MSVGRRFDLVAAVKNLLVRDSLFVFLARCGDGEVRYCCCCCDGCCVQERLPFERNDWNKFVGRRKRSVLRYL